MSDRPTVLVVQHEDQCPPAWMGEWLDDAGCALDVRQPHHGEALPATLEDHGAMLVLGGSMGAYDDDHDWLPGVKSLIRLAATVRVPTLGICLGHQLCAVALGGHVTRNPRGQQLGLTGIGWLPAAAGDAMTTALTDTPRGVQWNDDIVDVLPEGAVLLAATAAGEPQAVRFAPTVWGVQLHPEADEKVIGPWAEEDRTRHGDAVIDDTVAAVAAAHEELERGWRPLAESLARLAGSDR